MDEQHIYAQVLYPNIGGFGGGSWLGYGDAAFALECVQAYNDFQMDFASVAPDRLLPIVSLPFWDVDARWPRSSAASPRAIAGINFCNQPEAFDQPPLWDRHWDPIWSVAQDTGVTGQLPHRRRAHR